MKYKVGDRVRIVSKKDNSYWNPSGMMDKWLGKTVTIRVVRSGYYRLAEDGGEWCWYEDMIAGLALATYELHITCNDGVTTNAVYKRNGKIVKRAKAVCAPSDEFSFGEGTRLAFNRVMYGTDYCPAEVAFKAEGKPTPKFKAGDKVRVVDDTCCHCFNDGDVIILAGQTIINGKPAWLVEGSHFYVREADIEPYTEPEQEPVKLYCVKEFSQFGKRELIKGKVYEFDGHRVNYEVTKCFYAKDFESWKRGDPGFSACLVPLVKREAQAGEWIYAVHKGRFDYYEIGQIMQVSARFDCGGGLYANVEGDSEEHQLYDGEYLVLDGYQPEPEYLNMKVVCVEAAGDFTVGKIYEFVDGKVKDNDGDPRPRPGDPAVKIRSLEDWNDVYSCAKFIEFKGEQS